MFRDQFFAGALAFLCTALCATTSQPARAALEYGSQAVQQSDAYSVTVPAITQITQTINNSVRQQLVGNTDNQLLAGQDLGAVADDFPMQNMWLVLRRSPARESAYEQLIDQLHDRSSPNFHHWLTAEQVGTLFGPAQQDIDTVMAWLSDEGFTVNGVSTGGMVIDFSGTAATVRSAFGTEMHYFNVGGARYLSNTRDPSMPTALLPAVVGVSSLNNHFPHSLMHRRDEVQSHAAYNSLSKFLPAVANFNVALAEVIIRRRTGRFQHDLQTEPVWANNIRGAGQTIAVIEDTLMKNVSDVATFRSAFGLSGYSGTFAQVVATGSATCANPGVNGDEGEAALDAEWAGVAAPDANVELAACADTATVFGGLIAAENLINSATPPKILSVSYGFCEASNGAASNQAYVNAWQQAASEGITVFVSSGDEGAASCDANLASASHGIAVSGFASTPYNVAVGGTDFEDTYSSLTGGPAVSTYWANANNAGFESALSYLPEIPWNNSCAGKLLYTLEGYAQSYGASGFCNSTTGRNFRTTAAGSGGPSAYSSQPSWQTGVPGLPAQSGGQRGLPDVSLFAANGLWNHFLVFCLSDTAQAGVTCDYTNSTDVNALAAGGTSFSAPALAGIQALINQSSGSSWGNMNTQYYPLAATEYNNSTQLAACNSSSVPGANNTCVFYDITQGDIDVNCTNTSANCFGGSATNRGALSPSTTTYSPAYGTNAGWDYSTGLGSVNVTNLVAAMTPSLPFKLAFTQQPAGSYASHGTITVKASIENFAGNVVASNTSAVTLSLQGGTAGAALGGTLTQNAVAGVATFNVSVDALGTGYTLMAADGGLRGATSSAFNITAGPAVALSFSTQPSDAVAGVNITPAIVVHAQDAFANPVSGDGIALTIANNAGGATLSGGASVTTDSNGNATFAVVSLNKSGSGYTLTATDSSATPLTQTSSAFDISAAAAAKLVFTTQPPANSTFGSPFGAAVSVEDSFGNVVASNTSQVGVALTVPGSATLNGASSVNAVAGVATFSGLSVDTTGSYTLTATDGGLTSAQSATFAIGLADQTITFTSTAPAGATVGGTYAVSANGGDSHNPVTFTIDATSTVGACSIVGSLVSFGGAGTCVIDANQAGDGNYNAAPQVQQSFAIGAASQTITFPNPGPVIYSTGGTFALSATASSALPVAYASITTGVCTVAGSTATIVSAGTCSITATQTGNANFTAATPVTDDIAINQASQSITFTSTPPTTGTPNGPTYTVTAATSSTLPVSLSIDASSTGICTIDGTASGSSVSFVAVGTCVIDADQAGDGNFTAAPQQQQSIAVTIGSGSQLVFTIEPTNILIGNPASTVQVTEEDAFGNVVGDNATVTFTVAACSGNVTLGSAAMSGGVATFSSGPDFYTSASGLQIAATSGPLQGVSSTFNVASNSDEVFVGNFETCTL